MLELKVEAMIPSLSALPINIWKLIISCHGKSFLTLQGTKQHPLHVTSSYPSPNYDNQKCTAQRLWGRHEITSILDGQKQNDLSKKTEK